MYFHYSSTNLGDGDAVPIYTNAPMKKILLGLILNNYPTLDTIPEEITLNPETLCDDIAEVGIKDIPMTAGGHYFSKEHAIEILDSLVNEQVKVTIFNDSSSAFYLNILKNNGMYRIVKKREDT